MTYNGTPPFFPPNFVFWTNEDSHHQAHSTLTPFLPTNQQDLRGAYTMLGKRSVSFSGIDACEELNMEDELFDDGSHLGERKRRLNLEQVRTLEKNFEMGNKLDPERKMQLARALGLQPRQIAIWFQNKRARWKTKQLEKDFDALKRKFEATKAENDALQAQNKRLQAEILVLKGIETSEPINLNKRTEGSYSNRSENSSDINLDISRAPTTDSPSNPDQSRIFFPPYRPQSVAQLLQGSSKIEILCPKVEHDENLCNMLGSMEDQSAFWAWSEQHNFQ